jgi:hypothetical protein
MGIRMNCCPSYFFNQTESTIALTESEVDLITLPVTTETVGERVRIDSMLFTFLQTLVTGDRFGYQLVYRLLRDNDLLTEILGSQRNISKPMGELATINSVSPLTWTDIPPTPGTYTYRITGTIFETINLGFSANFVRSIDAIVFPAINP